MPAMSSYEAHVDHAVGFVQHQHFHRAEIDAAAPEVIANAPRRADDHDVRAVLQRWRSAAHRRTAGERQTTLTLSSAAAPAAAALVAT
jgi:hypothetical protein